MATTYVVDESGTRAFVKSQWTAQIDPRENARMLISFDSSIVNGTPLLANMGITPFSYASDIEVRFRSKADALGASLTPGSTSYNAFNAGAIDEGTKTITSGAYFEHQMDPSNVNQSGNTDFRIATTEESTGFPVNVIVGIDTTERTDVDNAPKYCVKTTNKLVPTTKRIPTTKRVPTTKITPDASYNYCVLGRIDGEVKATIDPNDKPPVEN
jgi:hypothetical protein